MLRSIYSCVWLACLLLPLAVAGQQPLPSPGPSQLSPAPWGGESPPALPPYVDLDGYPVAPAYELYPQGGMAMGGGFIQAEPWSCQLLPDGLVYESYLASTKESRFSTHIFRNRQDSTLFEGNLGTRIGLVRWGTTDIYRPEGWQIDAEGSGQVRLDIPAEVDVRSADFRAGLPITYGVGPHRVRFGYYHLSSHVGDEFLAKNPTFQRVNFSRDVLFLGYSHYITPLLRAYAEAGWAFHSDVTEPWEFQFGVDYAPAGPTGLRGAPFAAANAHLRQEVNFGGGFELQAGWAWRGDRSANMLRTGLHYYNGESNQFSFFDEHEEQIGFGLWYDF